MSTIGELTVTLGADVSRMERDFSRAGDIVQGFGRKVKGVGDSLSGLGRKLSLFVTTPLLAAAGAGIKFAADMESSATAFGVFLGNAEKGTKLFQDLVDFSAKTPLQLEGINNAASLLLATGVEADRLVDTLRLLGNAARGDSELLKRMALNLGQVKTQGKLTGRELRDFAVAGVPLIQELAKNLGKTTDEIQKMVSQGKIGFEDVRNAFKSLSGPGGRFENLMEKMAKTLKGKWTTALDNVKIALGNLFTDFLPMIKNFLDKIILVAQWFDNLSSTTKKWILITLGIVAAIGPILLIVGGIISAIGILITAIGTVISTGPLILAIVAAIGGVGAALISAVGEGETFAERFKSIIDKIVSWWNNLGDTIQAKVFGIIDIILNAVKTIIKVVTTAEGMMKGAIMTVINAIDTAIAGVVASVAANIEVMIGTILKGVNLAVKGLNKIPGVDITPVGKDVMKALTNIRKGSVKWFNESSKRLLSGEEWKEQMKKASLKSFGMQLQVDQFGDDMKSMVTKFANGMNITSGEGGEGGGDDSLPPSPEIITDPSKYAGALEEGSVDAYSAMLNGNKVEKNIEKNTKEAVTLLKETKQAITEKDLQIDFSTEDW